MCRTALFQKDEVLMFRAPATATMASAAMNGEMTIRDGTLAELAKLSADYPREFTAEKLEKAGSRLKSGDTLHLAWLGGGCAHVAWTGLRDGIKAESDVGPGCGISFERPSLVIYNCWTPPAVRGQGVYAKVLRQLISKGQQAGLDVWIICRSENIPSRRGIESAGFHREHRAVRKRYFYFLETKKVVPVASPPVCDANAVDPHSNPSIKSV
jgi:predicted GNAT family acetyltransferase